MLQQCVAECENEETASLDISKSISYGHDIMPSTDHALSMHQLCSEENDEVHAVLNPKGIDLCQTADEIHAVLNAKGNDLSQTAVRVILRQRAMLVCIISLEYTLNKHFEVLSNFYCLKTIY